MARTSRSDLELIGFLRSHDLLTFETADSSADGDGASQRKFPEGMGSRNGVGVDFWT